MNLNLPKNPVAMRGTIERCWLFTYRTPAPDAAPLVPPQFELVTAGGFAFWNVVVCQIARMRPAGLPFGIRYRHVAYRLYVRYRPGNPGRPPIEGLYFLRSDCDKPVITAAGNAFTDFRFHTARIDLRTNGNRSVIEVAAQDGNASALVDAGRHPELGWRSPFQSLEKASAFLKYKPFGIAPHGPRGAHVVAIARDESRWRSRIVSVAYAHWDFLEGRKIEPEICYEVDPIDYQWNRSVIYEGAKHPVAELVPLSA